MIQKATAKHMMWGDKDLYKGGDGKKEINIKDIIGRRYAKFRALLNVRMRMEESQALTALIIFY